MLFIVTLIFCFYTSVSCKVFYRHQTNFLKVSYSGTSHFSGFIVFLHLTKFSVWHKNNLIIPFLFLFPDNVELILKDIGSRIGSENQEPEQPDYDSVASDEDAEREPGSAKDERTKVCFSCKYSSDMEANLHRQYGTALRSHVA